LEYYEWKKCSYSGSEQNENFSKYLQDKYSTSSWKKLVMQITQKKVKAIFAVNCVILCSKSKFKLLYLKIWAYILSNFFLRWFWICYNHLNQKIYPLRSAPSAFLLSQKKPKMPFFMNILDIWFLCGKEYKSKKNILFQKHLQQTCDK